MRIDSQLNDTGKAARKDKFEAVVSSTRSKE